MSAALLRNRCLALLAAGLLAACAADPEPEASGASEAAQALRSGPPAPPETDAAMAQVVRCWNFPVGAPDNEAMIVKLRIFLDPDGTLRRLQVIDRENAERSAYRRISVEAAARAVTRCSPLRMPAETYERWKELVLVFDPSAWLPK